VKRYTAYILVGVLIFVCGILAGWGLNTRNLKRRVVPPFDRSLYQSIHIDFGDEIIFSQHGGGDKKTYSFGGGYGDVTPCTLTLLEKTAWRISRCVPNYRVCVSVDTNATLNDLLALHDMVASNKFSDVKLLVEYPPVQRDSPLREFRYLRLGEQNEVQWHQMEWFFEAEATSIQKNEPTALSYWGQKAK
jgi:hypothetical protein